MAKNEDVALKLFVKSLERDVYLWFKRIPHKSIKNWNDLIAPFLKPWETKMDVTSLLISMHQI